MNELIRSANTPRSVAALLIAIGTIGSFLLAAGSRDYPHLHLVLDTAAALLSGVLAFLFLDVGVRIGRFFPRSVAVSFGVTSLSELAHVLVTMEWSGPLVAIVEAESVLRPATWPLAAYALPAGLGSSLLGLKRGWKNGAGLGVALLVLSAALLPLFLWLPRYGPVALGVTRPTLILVPFLWAVIGYCCWRYRAQERMFPMLAVAAGVILVGSLSMLYSKAPHDTHAMVAHLGKVGAYLVLLLSLMQMAAADMAKRIRAEGELSRANESLERRVQERTQLLGTTNRALEDEIGVRRHAEQDVRAQLGRLNLLHQITRAIADRQDLRSIFQVVIHSLEDQLPIDFGCVCLYDQPRNELIVTSVGARSESLAIELAMTEQAHISIDQNGLSRCVLGELVSEPDLGAVPFAFPRRLAQASLRALVAAPLLAESRVFGVLIAARREAASFSSGECEFLRQLSEHVALAAHHAQLYLALQGAYDDLRRTQQAVLQQERLRALGQMASGIAHDINNAMSPVAVYTDLLLDEDPTLSAQAREYLEIIRRAGRDVTHTVGRMREFYRHSEPELILTPVALNPLVKQVVDLTRARWNDMPLQRGIVIEVVNDLAADLPAVMGIESEIRDALTNLVFNAVDALPEGGRITLRTVAADGGGTLGRVFLEITDTGVGMSEDTRRQCFEPFFTTKGERGTGLGLAMVYGVAQRHDAEIEIESAPGRGTTVRLDFPAAAADAPDAPPTSAPVVQARLRILVIDDDPLILKALRDALETAGHLVATANGGQAGIDTFQAAGARRETFAIVITDLGMPHVDGRKVASAIKEMSPATPIILLTGWGQRLIAEGDVPAQVDRILGKPPRMRELREAFAQLCSAPRADGPLGG